MQKYVDHTFLVTNNLLKATSVTWNNKPVAIQMNVRVL